MPTSLPQTGVRISRKYSHALRQSLLALPYANVVMTINDTCAMADVPVRMLSAFAPTASTFIDGSIIRIPRKIQDSSGVLKVLAWLVDCCKKPEPDELPAPDSIIECVQIHQILSLFGMTHEACQLGRILLLMLKNEVLSAAEAEYVWESAKSSTEARPFIHAMVTNLATHQVKWVFLDGSLLYDASLKMFLDSEPELKRSVTKACEELRPSSRDVACRVGTPRPHLVPAPLDISGAASSRALMLPPPRPLGSRENPIALSDERVGPAGISVELAKWRADRIWAWVSEQRKGVLVRGKAFYKSDSKNPLRTFLELPHD